MQPLPNNPFLQSFTTTSAPVLLLAGENDTTMGMAPVRRLEANIKAAGAPYELVAYPDPEHRFDPNNLRPRNGAAAVGPRARTLASFRKTVRERTPFSAR